MSRIRTTRSRPLALAYVRVSTVEQAQEGASLEAQRGSLQAEASRRGWDVELVSDEGYSAKDLKRPGLLDALERLDRGEAQTHCWRSGSTVYRGPCRTSLGCSRGRGAEGGASYFSRPTSTPRIQPASSRRTSWQLRRSTSATSSAPGHERAWRSDGPKACTSAAPGASPMQWWLGS